MLELVNLKGFEKRSIDSLSGGQQQRVAIARTLSLKPDIILFDEPMSALDADNRLILRKELKALQKEFKTTMIYITHDQEEAFSLSDREDASTFCLAHSTAESLVSSKVDSLNT